MHGAWLATAPTSTTGVYGVLGSQALETAIGLVMMFFILATAASTVTESISRAMSKRAKDLEKSIAALLEGDNLQQLLDGKDRKAQKDQIDKCLEWLKGTSIWQGVAASSGKNVRRQAKGPSYLSAKQFADAVAEMLTHHPQSAPPPATADPVLETAESARVAGQGSPDPAAIESTPHTATHDPVHADSLPANLQRRLDALVAEGRTDLLSLKSGIETWFDEAMSRTEGAYKRWATVILFVVGLLLAVGLNLSTLSVASALWADPVTRDAVANAASGQAGSGSNDITSVAAATNKVTSLQIPGGWTVEHRKVWSSAHWYTVTWDRTSDLIGWLLTAVLVMLGAPFWFDILGRLVSLRGAGTKPATAANDYASATTAVSAPTIPGSSPAGPATDQFARDVRLIP